MTYAPLLFHEQLHVHLRELHIDVGVVPREDVLVVLAVGLAVDLDPQYHTKSLAPACTRMPCPCRNRCWNRKMYPRRPRRYMFLQVISILQWCVNNHCTVSKEQGSFAN